MKIVARPAREAMAIRHWLTRPSFRFGVQGRTPPPPGTLSGLAFLVDVVVVNAGNKLFLFGILGNKTPKEELEGVVSAVVKMAVVETVSLVETGPVVYVDSLLRPMVEMDSLVGPMVEVDSVVKIGSVVEVGSLEEIRPTVEVEEKGSLGETY